jgi:hypothetical protein
MNKNLRPDTLTIKKSKMDKLAKKLKSSLGSSDFYTAEQYLSEAAKILTDYQRMEDKPIDHSDSVPKVGDISQPVLYNQLFTDIKDNLEVIFEGFENLEDFILANFNYAVTGTKRLQSRMKATRSLVYDYLLYVDNSGDFTFSQDSFNDVNRVDTGSTLLSQDECTVESSEGIVTLPVDNTKESTISVTNTPLVNEQSNGKNGNNEELGAQRHNNLRDILDNNPDTWFEYERVTKQINDTGEALILDITLVLNTIVPINHIRVNPNNFGTRSAVEIVEIATSIDGITYTNIKDDIPIVDYIQDDEENIFLLSSATSKYAGQGLYSFTPRKAKYVHFVFKQVEPYAIQTETGQKLRYAIGIRDIELKHIVYKPVGEIISTEFNIGTDISKVQLLATQEPVNQSTLASIKHHISTDNGATWHEIRPRRDVGISGAESEIPEILNFNNAAANAVKTNLPVTRLRWKGVLERFAAGFDPNTTQLYEIRLPTSEVHDVPSSSPHILALDNHPVGDTVVVMDPLYGSCGLPRYSYTLGSGQNFKLPNWREINKLRPRTKAEIGSSDVFFTPRVKDEDWIHVEVGGIEWSVATNSTFSGYTSTDLVYWVDWNYNRLLFGDDTTGKRPDEDVQIYFDAERIAPIDGYGTNTSLTFPFVPEKSFMILESYEQLKDGLSQVAQGAVAVDLDHDHIETITTTISGVQKTFVNGSDEFSSATNEWSVDIDKGIVYFSGSRTDVTSIAYTYYPVEEINPSFWEFTSDKKHIQILQSGWRSNNRTYTVPVSHPSLPTRTIHLQDLAIVRGTLKINASGVTSATNPFLREVPYFNGVSELSNYILITQEIGALSSGPSHVISLDDQIVSADAVIFEERGTYFTTDVGAGTPSSNGEYKIDVSANTITLYWDTSIGDAGKVFYYRIGTYADEGRYSVDYVNGIIYTQRSVKVPSSLVIEYEYTDFRMKYPIAREIPTTDYTVDYDRQRIVLNSRDILETYNVDSQHGARYYISYDYIVKVRSDILELKDYFSPILKDYTLRIVTKS